MLKLVESFLSFQGEGKYAGRLAVFVRFAGCNLRCKGFGVRKISPKTGEILIGCDTIRATYTSHFDYIDVTSKDFLVQRVLELAKDFKPIVVITGGEPMLWHKNKIFYGFVSELLHRDFDVHFETNGSVEIDFDAFSEYKNTVFAISVKLKTSGESKEKRINYNALRAIKQYAKDSFYKFVISDESSKDEISEIVSNAPNMVYCMPLGDDIKALTSNAKNVANFCIENGFCYSDRVHIRIYNDKEGI